MLTKKELFWNKVDKNGPMILDTPCWNWIGCINSHGYGQFRIGGKMLLSHRISWEWYYGNSHENLFVCHKCDNSKCVNPEHLFVGTQKDNMRDMISKNRSSYNKKLTNTQVLQIYNSTKQTKDLAEEYGVHRQTIREIKRGITYKKLTNHQFKKVGRRKLTGEEVLLIFNSCKATRKISEEFNVSPAMIKLIKRGKCHSKITGCVS